MYLYCLAKNRPCNFPKKLFVQVIFSPHLKFSQHGLFSAKKIKTKGSFIVRLRNFYHYSLETETEEIVSKKIN